MAMLSEYCHLVKGLDPVADAFAGTVYSDVVNMRDWKHVTFIIVKGVGTTGTSTVTVQACDDTTPSNRSAVAFHYRACTSGDTWGALTAATSSGFTTTAGSSQRYIIEVDSEKLAASGYGYVQLKMVEVANDPVLGGIEILLSGPRYIRATNPTAIT